MLRRPEVSSVTSRVSASPVDERLNQLDELQSQDESSSPSVVAWLSGVVNEACESAIGALDASINSTSGSSAEDSFLQPRDVSMSEPSSAWKRELRLFPLMAPVGPGLAIARSLVLLACICHLVSLRLQI